MADAKVTPLTPDQEEIESFLRWSAGKLLNFIFEKADEAIATGQSDSDEYAMATVEQFAAGLRAVFDAGHDYAVLRHTHDGKMPQSPIKR